MTDNTTASQARTKKGMIKAFIIVGVILLILFGSIFGFNAFIGSKKSEIKSNWKMQPIVISAEKAKSLTWTPYIDATGSATAIQSINVSAQTSGLVSAIHFKSGQNVKKGEVLFTLDSAELQAQLKQAQADEALKKITYKRDAELYKTKAVSQQTLDTSEADYAAAKATREGSQASINYTIIRAPFSGKIGIRNISLGGFFQQGDTAATLDTISPIFIDFTVSGDSLAQVKPGQEVEVFADTRPDKVFKGKVVALNSRISENTRALEVRAELENKDQEIFPGMFLTIHLMLPEQNKVISVPQTSINYTLYGVTIYVLSPVMDKNGKQETASYNIQSDPTHLVRTQDKVYIAKSVPVTVGTLNGKLASIDSGIKAGDLVVNSGQLKLKDGVRVTIDNKYMPVVK